MKILELPGVDVTSVLNTELLICSSVMDTVAATEERMLATGSTEGVPALDGMVTASAVLDKKVAPLQLRLHAESEAERDEWFSALLEQSGAVFTPKKVCDTVVLPSTVCDPVVLFSCPRLSARPTNALSVHASPPPVKRPSRSTARATRAGRVATAWGLPPFLSSARPGQEEGSRGAAAPLLASATWMH